jgi:hypothetical protein
MPLDFPNSPTNGQVFTSGTKQWAWNGEQWAAKNPLGSNYLPLSGGTMSGMLNVLSVTETKGTPSIVSNTLTLDLASAVVFNVNLNSPITTFTLTNVPSNPKVYSFALQLVADGTSRSVVWPTGTRWSGGSAPTLTTTAGKVDTFTFLTHDGGTSWFGYTNDQNQ